MSKPCKRCNGTGYDSAARCMGMDDLPRSMQPFGVFPCEECGGTGKQFITEFKFMPEEVERIQKLFKRLKTIRMIYD